MEGNVAATYALIYRFLKQRSQNKAAEAVKKAAKPVVVLRDDIEQEGPSLEDIIKEWKAKQSIKPRVVFPSVSQGRVDLPGETDSSSDSSDDSEDSSGSDSSSEDTSGSESEDDDTSDSDATKAKKLPQKAPKRDTSITLSSEHDREVAKQVVQIPKKLITADDESEDTDSDDSSDSDDSDSDSASASDSSDAETSSGSDSSDEEEANAKAPPKTKAKSSSSSESSSDSEDESDSEPSPPKEDAHAAKRRKTSQHGAAVTTAVVTESQQSAGASQKKEKPAPKAHERFQRVKVQSMASEMLLDNGYVAKGGTTNDYGQRAHRDLIVTRGAGFRKEKNKKKRGSYRGGEITMENHSIRFDD